MNRRTLSRIRFAEYRRYVAARQRGDLAPGSEEAALAAVFRPTENMSRRRSTSELVRVFWQLLGRHRRATAFALTLLTISVGLSLAPLYIPKIIIDSVLGTEPLPAVLAGILPADPVKLLITLVVVFVAMFFAAETIRLWGRWHATRVNRRLQAEVRRKTFDHACQLPLHRVFALKSGGTASILRDDAGSVGELVTRGLYQPWHAVVQLLGSLAILVWIDWRLLLVGVGIIPAGWITHYMWVKRIRPLSRDIRHTRAEIDSHATEVFGGMRIVRAFGRRRAEAGAFVRRLNLMVRQELYTWWWMRGIDTAWAIAAPLGVGVLLLLGSWRILSDREAVAAGSLPAEAAFTTGSLVAFLAYLASLIRPISTLAATATDLQSSLAGLDRTLDLLEEEIETPPSAARAATAAAAAGGRRLSAIRGDIRLEGVGFRYPHTNEAALADIDLEAPAGTVTAFVGASGSGKTTLCNLIARFYRPTEGGVWLDGIDIEEIDLDRYRQLLGIVEQDIFLFDGAIAENIGYGRRDVTEADLRRAAELANAHEFIEQLPQGYQTMVGERGVRLSGGQRQRIAIARAILADPRILILDEATSALDTESERLIQESLAALLADRTSFLIAHRLSTIMHADQIVVLEAGRIVDRGTHEELLAASRQYRRMIELQIMDESPATLRAAAARGRERLGEPLSVNGGTIRP